MPTASDTHSVAAITAQISDKTPIRNIRPMP